MKSIHEVEGERDHADEDNVGGDRRHRGLTQVCLTTMPSTMEATSSHLSSASSTWS